MSDLAHYHTVSPNTSIEGCLNTGESDTDGVIFPNVEPLMAEYCFVGRQSIYEAFAELEKITVDDVKKLLKVKDQNRQLKLELKAARAELDRWTDFQHKLTDVGLALPELE